MANGVLYYGADGRLNQQKAEIIIMACNGVGTPRLLLNSKSDLFPEGLANNSGLVGKNLMFHPLTGVAGVFDEPMKGHEGPMACSILSQEFYESDSSRGFIRGYGLHSGRSTTPMTFALGGYGIDNPIPWGDEHREIMDNMYPYLAGLTIVTEDLPEEHNCVTLDNELKDSDGIPAPKISYRVSENTKAMIKHGEERAREVLIAAGAKKILSKNNPIDFIEEYVLNYEIEKVRDSRDEIIIFSKGVWRNYEISFKWDSKRKIIEIITYFEISKFSKTLPPSLPPSFSPTPTAYIGSLKVCAKEIITPPFALPSNFVIIIPVKPIDSSKLFN